MYVGFLIHLGLLKLSPMITTAKVCYSSMALEGGWLR